MEPQPTSDTPPPTEKVFLEPTNANLKKIRRSRWWTLLYFVVILALPAIDISRDNRRFNIDQKFRDTFHAVKLNDAYRDDLFYTPPTVLAASSGSFDKVAVYYDRQQLAILGLKENKIVSCYMASYKLGYSSLRVDEIILADWYSQPYDPSILTELTAPSRTRLLELFLLVFDNDEAVKANMNASSQKGYAVMRGEIYVFLVTQLKINPGIEINKYRDF